MTFTDKYLLFNFIPSKKDRKVLLLNENEIFTAGSRPLLHGIYWMIQIKAIKDLLNLSTKRMYISISGENNRSKF